MPWDQKAREKIAEANRRRVWSPESLDKLSKSHLGIKHRAETKIKIGISQRGEKHYNWKGGKTIDANGYVRTLCRDHPYAENSGRVLEHRLVMEKHLGRFLSPEEVVHHINGIVNDNRIENLELFSSSGDHTGYHNTERSACPGM